MKKITIVILAALAVIFFAARSSAQDNFARENLTPLYLFTSDGGSITPYENGQLLEVGRRYNIRAVPDPGYTFSGWQQVNVFIFTTIIVDPPFTNTSSVVSPLTEIFKTPALVFVMQPQEVISSSVNTTVALSVGWQANFTPKVQRSPVPMGTNQLNGGESIRRPAVQGDANRAVW